MDCDERGEAINKKAANRSSKGLKNKKSMEREKKNREREKEREREKKNRERETGDRSKFFKRVRII